MVSTPLMAISGEDGDTHVALVDTANDFQRGQLKSLGVKVLEDYGQMAMVSGTDAQLSKLTLRRDLDDRSVISMAGYLFDTTKGLSLAAIPEKLLQDAPSEGVGHYLVQFHGPVKQSWKDALVSVGAEPIGYVPEFSFIVRMEARTVPSVEAMPFVSYVGNYQPAFKIAENVHNGIGLLDLNVVLYPGEDPYRVAGDLWAMGTDVTYISADQINPTIEATVLDRDIPSVARMEPVMSVMMRFKGGLPPNDPAQWISQSNIQNDYPLYDHGIHGENMTIGNADTGIDVNHLAFKDAARNVQFSDPAANTAPDLQHRKIVNYWLFANDQGGDTYGHGSMTVGVNAGDNDANAGNPQYHGMAYKAKVSFQDVWLDATWADMRPADKGKMYEKSWNDGAWIHSGSLVCVAGGEYNDDAQELDQFLWNHKDFLGVIANHNYGTGDVASSVCDMASAKGTMSIGAVLNSPNQEDLHDYTGRGPTQDGRLKPTLSAVTDINSPDSGTQNAFASLGGTSGATPDAAGNMVLARQYFYDGFYPSGERTPADGFNASGALLKAIGINSAAEMTGDNAYVLPYNTMPYPSNTQGWGRLTLDDALYFAGDTKGLILDDNKTGLSTGETAEYPVSIVSSTDPLEVTLVWTDYWGTLNTNPELVNDLDLQVTAPDGLTVYKGNRIGGSASPYQSVTGGSFDNKNVEENIINITPTVGTWTVKISGVNTPQGPQPYALVITGNISRVDDLAVTAKDIKFSKLDPVEGDNVTVNITVRNLGGNPLPDVDIELELDGVMLLSKSLPLAGGAIKFETVWQSTWGEHTFKVIADPMDLISEAKNTNNMAERRIYVNKVPTANFSAGPLEIFTFENVTINASTSADDGKVGKYKFDWGDGSAVQWAFAIEATHEYKKVGKYNITVKVMDNTSLESSWAPKVQVTVKNRDPQVNASASTYEAYTLVNVSFDGSKSWDREGVVTYLWDFDDANHSTSSKPVHAYKDDGYYNVTLTIKDTNNATNTTKLMVHILNRAPTASFKSSGNFGNVTTQFNFVPTVDDMDGTVVRFQWDFGDGTKTESEAPIHYYKDDGAYNVTFVVTDDDGASSDVVSFMITIENLAPIANITVDRSVVLTDEPIHFTSVSDDIDGQIVNMTWNMGDGKFYYGPTVTHAYDENKVYSINLKVIDDDDAMAEFNVTVKVNNRPPVANAEWNTSAVAGRLIIFSAENSTDQDGSILSYMWDFGNNTIKREAVVNFTYWYEGTYYVNLTVTDNDLAKNTIQIKVDVAPPPPIPEKPKPEANLLSSVLLWGIIAAIVMTTLIVVAVMLMKRKKPAAQTFDPNATAQQPTPDIAGSPPPDNMPQSSDAPSAEDADAMPQAEITGETGTAATEPEVKP